MATCYLCGKSHAEYRREVKTGNSYRTGISSRGRTSYSTQSHYGPRCVCAECALQIDYNSQKRSSGAFVFNMFGTMSLACFWIFLLIFGPKGFVICGIISIVCYISAVICKHNKAIEADAWYEANKGQYIDNIDIKEIATASQKFAKVLEKGFNTLIDKIFRFKDSANKCLVTSKNPNDFKRFYEDCNSVVGYIDSFINQTQEEIRKFNDNIRKQYGSKDIVNKALNDCSSSWKNIIDTLVKEKSEIQQLQKSFILDENITDTSATSTAVSTNVPLGYKTADVFDQNFWNQQFWENVSVEQVQRSSPSGYKNVTSGGYSALYYAAFYSNNVEILKALIDKGCDVNAKDNNGNTIPIFLVDKKYYKADFLREILKHNFDINQIYDNKDTLLTYALKQNPTFEIIKTLIEFGADVNLPGFDGYRPIEIAAHKKEISIDILKLLLNTGAQIYENEGKYSALTLAAMAQESTDKINLLIQFGYKVDLIIDEDNATSLFCACLKENNQININALLDNGANINQQTNTLHTVLWETIVQNHPENAEVLINRGADFTICDERMVSPLIVAATVGDIKTLKLLISKGADVNQYAEKGISALMQCCQANNSNEVLDILLNAGADVKHKSQDGSTVLFNALFDNKDKAFIDKLLKYDLDINSCNSDGEFPLQIALTKETHVDVIQLLLEKGADKNMKDKNGNTMMQLALKNPNAEIVKIFMN